MYKHVLHIILYTYSQYTPDQNTNINKGMYMQPQIHTAWTRDYNVEQIWLYHNDQMTFEFIKSKVHPRAGHEGPEGK
jgi:uncharacterized protein YchJ